jgi:hypothetical protein
MNAAYLFGNAGMKSLKKFVGFFVSFATAGSLATAGGLSPDLIEPEVEAVVIDKGKSSSVGILPILALLALVAIVVSQRDDDDGVKQKKAP